MVSGRYFFDVWEDMYWKMETNGGGDVHESSRKGPRLLLRGFRGLRKSEYFEESGKQTHA
jgi:hypothetical protein